MNGQWTKSSAASLTFLHHVVLQFRSFHQLAGEDIVAPLVTVNYVRFVSACRPRKVTVCFQTYTLQSRVDETPHWPAHGCHWWLYVLSMQSVMLWHHTVRLETFWPTYTVNWTKSVFICYMFLPAQTIFRHKELHNNTKVNLYDPTNNWDLGSVPGAQHLTAPAL